jgi:hypothetical protein
VIRLPGTMLRTGRSSSSSRARRFRCQNDSDEDALIFGTGAPAESRPEILES